MPANPWISALLMAAGFSANAHALAITSKPVLIAFAKRAGDHPYSYQVASDAGTTAVTYSLEKAPQGMTISATGKIDWVPLQSQAYDNAVTVKVAAGGSEATQSFNVFVLGLTQAARDALKSKNRAWVAGYKAQTTGTERPNYHMIMFIGDSQSMASNWGSAILDASTSNDATFPHYPRFWGSYKSSESVCQQVSNGNEGQSAMRSSGHSQEYGNLSSQQATFGMGVVRTAVTNTCVTGAATATVAFGHNDAVAKKDAAVFVSQMSAICDSLLAFNIIPIVFTVSPGVEGGTWGTPEALALYPKYRDSVVAMCKRRNLPCIDVYSAVQTALNTGSASSLASMYNDGVHYKYDATATSMNPLHNGAFALNIVDHMLAHMMGYLYESGAHAPVLDTYAASFYPQGLPKDPNRSATYLTDYGGDVSSVYRVPIVPGRPGADASSRPGQEIRFLLDGEVTGGQARVSLFDAHGKPVSVLFSGIVPPGLTEFRIAWKGTDDDGRPMREGVYFAQLRLGSRVFSKQVLRISGGR